MPGKSILIVDDSSVLRAALKAVLQQQAGIDRVEEAADGAEALGKLHSTRFDLMILDIVMPVMDGFALLEELQARPLPYRLQTIVASAMACEDAVQRAMMLGARFFMAKPFEIEHLLLHCSAVLTDMPRHDLPRASASCGEKLSALLLSIGVPAHVCGYRYLRTAVKMVAEDPALIHRLTRGLYPAVAEAYGATASKVERAIRHALGIAWERGRVEELNRYFGCRVCSRVDRPSNGQFIGMVAEKMRAQDVM